MFRFMNMVYAKVFGYFWIPCPVCGKYFGGHEIYMGPGLLVEQKESTDPLTGKQFVTFMRSKSVCSAECALKAAEINQKNGFYAGPVSIGPFCNR